MQSSYYPSGALLMKKDNKRNYFRVGISIPVRWRILNETETDLIKKGGGCSLLTQNVFKTQIDEMPVKTSSIRNDQIDHSLQLLNIKLDYIINMMLNDSVSATEDDRVVEISASGLKFLTAEKIDPGIFLKMDLLIPGSPHFQVELIAEVLRVENMANDYLIAANIIWIDDEAREFIVKMSFEKQRIDIRRIKTCKEVSKSD
jgi:hypothetical protein